MIILFIILFNVKKNNKNIIQVFWMKRTIKQLILSGGGVKGIAYIGAFKYIDELRQKRILEEKLGGFDKEKCMIPEFDIKEVCCVSVGSIVGLLYILGYTYEEFLDEIITKDLHNLKDFKIRNFLNKYGLDSGKMIINWIETLIIKKGYSKDLTLKDIWDLLGVNFRVVASNLNKYELDIFDYKKNPDLKVVKAIRMSISIPLIFSVEKYQNTIYVDGGIINNYPIKIYENELDTLLGLKLVTRGEFTSHIIDEKIDTFDNYLFHLMTCFLVQKEKETTLSYKYIDHTICIEAQSVTHTVNFSLSEDDKRRLIEIGYESASNYFKNVIEE